VKNKPDVLMIVTLDTKQQEAKFVRKCLEDAGLTVHHLDASIRLLVDGGAEIGPEQVAAAASKTIEEVRAIGHEGQCQAVMTEGATRCAHELHERVGLSGVIAIGGSMGTTLATAVMRSFPFGLPKVMISTMASGFTKGFVGTKDIAMFHSVADISGLNTVIRTAFRNGALALAGMAHGYEPVSRTDKPLVALSTLGTTEKCSVRIRKALEEKGYEVIVFHTLGTGGQAMDEIISEQDVKVAINLSVVEIGDLLHGGLCSAGPDRCKASLAKGVPTIFAPGNIDFVIAGPIDDAKARFPNMRYHIHNATLTAVRTEEKELKAVAEHITGLIKDAKGPVTFFVPLQGFSSHDSPEGHLHDLSMPPIFLKHLKAAMPEDVPVIDMDCHINDEEFADSIVQQTILYTQTQ
jgi:uncharacterized protein (UPF0261 family)